MVFFTALIGLLAITLAIVLIGLVIEFFEHRSASARRQRPASLPNVSRPPLR